MIKFNMFEKTSLDGYNRELEIFQIKFKIFSELKEFQKIGKLEVTKEEFFSEKNERN